MSRSSKDTAESPTGIDDNDNDDESNPAEHNDLGSGLASFFYETDVDDQPIGFSTGLSRLPPPTNLIENADFIDVMVGVEYADGGLLYSQWRASEKAHLLEYLNHRLYPHPTTPEDDQDETSSNESSSDEGKEEDGEEEPLIESQQLAMMETQEHLPVLDPESRRGEKKRRKTRIPCITDCLYDLTKLEYLDLNARTLTMNLSRIDVSWRLRCIKRCGGFDKRSIRKPVFQNCNGKRKDRRRLFYQEKEDDGPVAVIYKKVTHFEVEQLSLSGGNSDVLLSSSTNHGRHGGKGGLPQRIKVFFYNSYATAVSDWIERQQQDSQTKKKRRPQETTNGGDATGNAESIIETSTATDFIMSLINVPAVCIFPHEIDSRNWREERDLVDYCLCIGDKSTAKDKKQREVAANPENDNFIRFDSEEMEIRLMPVIRKTTMSRRTTDTGNIVSTNETFDVDSSSELVLSRRTIANDSSEDDSSPQGMTEGADGVEDFSPLQQNWNIYMEGRNGTASKDNGTDKDTMTINEQLERSSTKECNPQQPKERESRATSQKIYNDEENEAVPMVFQGVGERRTGSAAVKYVRLGDLGDIIQNKGSNFKVNVYASVLAVTPPRITKRGDFMVSATLIDESCYETPLTINIFCKTQNLLPDLVWVGDVIRIHRAVLQRWNGRIQLQGLKPTQYVVVRRTEPGWVALPTAPHYFTFTPSDERRAQALWRWGQRHQRDSPTAQNSNHCFTIAELQALRSEDDETRFRDRDITLMVVDKYRYEASGHHPHGMLRVWDGTGKPSSDPLFMQSKILPPSISESRGTASYTKAIEQVVLASQELQESFFDMGVPVALCGSVANVVVWEKSHWDLIEKHVPVGTFLRLRNVHIPQRWQGNEFRSIFMHDKSWMTALPRDNFEVQSLIRKHYDRVRKGKHNYNWGLHGHPPPNIKWVGNGLVPFRNQHDTTARVFTGAVHILLEGDAATRTVGMLRVVTVADRSGSIQAMVIKKLRDELCKMLCPPTQNCGEGTPKKRFLVRIRMFECDNEDGRDERRHFAVTNAALLD